MKLKQKLYNQQQYFHEKKFKEETTLIWYQNTISTLFRGYQNKNIWNLRKIKKIIVKKLLLEKAVRNILIFFFKFG